MTEWGLCTTLKAPVDQVQAFVAHHLGMGASRLWLFFDDPDDPGFDAVSGLSRVTATRCDMAYWLALAGKRPDKHQNRQNRNMQAVYAQTTLPWLGHIDVDEFLAPQRDIGLILDALPPDAKALRLAPWEALFDPALSDDIFTARHFRAAMRGNGPAADAARGRVFGEFAPLLPKGVLSHSAGKCIFRTGLSRFEPRLHGAFRAGQRVSLGEFSDAVALLHFHAEDPARWKERLQFRLTRGAYQFNPPLQEWLLAADAKGIDGFYAAVQTAAPDLLARLRQEGVLLECDLGLRAKIAAMGLV